MTLVERVLKVTINSWKIIWFIWSQTNEALGLIGVSRSNQFWMIESKLRIDKWVIRDGTDLEWDLD